MRITVENCSSIYIGSLQKTYKRNVIRENPGIRDPECFEKLDKELQKFTVNGQYFKYTSITNKLGGHRFFFLCPKCGQRSSKLFLPPKGSNLEYKYLCKRCHKLKNQSAIMGQSRVYQQVTRPLKRLKEIEKKLENGYLSTDKIKVLLDEYESIEAQMKNAPEYRLYVFKKQRNMI